MAINRESGIRQRQDARRARLSLRRGFFLIGILIILLLCITLVRAPLSGFLWRVTAPIESLRGGVGDLASATFAGFSSKAALQAQNAELTSELASLQALLVDRDELYRENIVLKEDLGRANLAASSTVLAGVIAAPPALPYDTLMIDAGSHNGVAVGIVSAGGSAFIGTVSDVYPSSARIELFSSPGETHPGLLQGTIPVSVEGDGAGALSTTVPSNTEVVLGDAIVFPGIMGGISEIVSGIEAPPGNSSKTLYLSLPANIFSLQFVEVVLAQKNS